MKLKTVYVCSECGFEAPKWTGKCPSCGAWNSMNEEVVEANPAAKTGVTALKEVTVKKLSEVGPDAEKRILTGIEELDRVLGHGIVSGSLVLIGGEPGIGKSTILLQMCGKLSGKFDILYVSGEESANQIKLRAQRLGIDGERVLILSETDITQIIAQIEKIRPGLVIIDSIQTITHPDIPSSAGSVTQVRECTGLFMRMAKTSQIPIFLVGHVNKDGAIAGPKVMEHIVDCVLYFEGERNHVYRILRTAKNRFGSTNEIGVFEMTASGLEEVQNPSAALLSGRPKNTSGSCIGCTIEGSRPILTEVQALVSKSGYGNARRMSAGFDYNRCCMMIAVLEKRCGIGFAEFDSYLNIVGGLELSEPAADLTVCLALASGKTDIPLPDDLIAFGEVGLAGELRSCGNDLMRVNEAARLGFTKCVLPLRSYTKIKSTAPAGIELMPYNTLNSCLRDILGAARKTNTSGRE